MSETPTSSESPKELLKRLLKKFEQEIKEQRAIKSKWRNGGFMLFKTDSWLWNR